MTLRRRGTAERPSGRSARSCGSTSAQREVRVVEPGPIEALCEAAAGADGLLLVGDRRRAPRTALPGPFLVDPSGRAVPAGWLPDLGSGLEVFARAAARVQRRSGTARAARRARPVGAALPPARRAPRGEPRPRRRASLPGAPLDVRADHAIGDLVDGLRLGLGVGIYFGHGRPKGWAGYHGLRAATSCEAAGEPLGALFSVTCLTANR